MEFDPAPGKTGFARQLFILRWHRLNLTRAAFCARYGLTVGLVKDAEQARGKPSGPLQALVASIEAAPDMVAKAVAVAGLATPEPKPVKAAKPYRRWDPDAGLEAALARRSARQPLQAPTAPAQPVDLKKLWREFLDEGDRAHAAWRARGYAHPAPMRPPFPDELRNLTCGAKNRRGEPCRRKDIYRNGRCKHHGGLSTGPKSEAGQARAKANLSRRWSGGGQD